MSEKVRILAMGSLTDSTGSIADVQVELSKLHADQRTFVLVSIYLMADICFKVCYIVYPQ